MPDAAIVATGLEKAFGKVRALDGVDLTVQPGEVYGFIGPNGAGKSTTIRCLLGILKADAGQAQVFGLDAWQDAVAIHHRLSYVPGDVNLWPNLTGGEVIDLFVRLKKNGDTGYRQELIERFDFDPTKKCGAYSKGNRQKVALIAAFSTDADLYILDEPTSGLDPLMELVFRECVLKVKQEGKTVLLSSHILSEVEHLCDRLSIIRQGRIVDTGSLRQMQHLTRCLVHVEAPAPLDGLGQLPGVHDLQLEPGEARFRLDNAETAAVMAFLASQGVTRLTSTPPTLEELFMSHYEG
ncbi:MAG: ABC transporter ATP-binding protein [Bifidobacteriaceae bacterium]|jgi:ABC-2 type transport system ATP-binding protein|nr:ABC transporter ATP-binding protein [Bifidobacteriaceae bacterium]